MSCSDVLKRHGNGLFEVVKLVLEGLFEVLNLLFKSVFQVPYLLLSRSGSRLGFHHTQP